jgi:alkylation response protein AidB-like acyl-CoA dehydrogenase
VPLLLSEDQVLIADTARPFLIERGGVRHLRALRDANDATAFSRELWAEFSAMGFSGALVPESEGGSGLGHVEAGIILEEIGRSLTPSPFLTTAVGAVTALAAASAEQRRRWVPSVVPSTRDRATAPSGSRSRPRAPATGSA